MCRGRPATSARARFAHHADRSEELERRECSRGLDLAPRSARRRRGRSRSARAGARRAAPIRRSSGRNDALEEVERRRQRVVRAALDRRRATARRGQQRREHRLQDERRAAGGADREPVLARRARAPGAKVERLRAELVAVARAAPHTAAAARTAVRCWRSSPGFSRPARMRVDAERRPVTSDEGERGAQDLPAALAHASRRSSSSSLAQPFTQTTWRSVCTTSTRSVCASITASIAL